MIQFNDSQSGIFILTLYFLGMCIFFLTPGSVRFQKPTGGIGSWIFVIVNLAYEMILLPLVAIIMVMERQDLLRPYQFAIAPEWLPTVMLTGAMILIGGTVLFFWARIAMQRSFRLAAVTPHPNDRLIVRGPYRLVRNPMYGAILINCIGFLLLVRSYLFGFMFLFFLLVLIIAVVPTEEKQLETFYTGQYDDYRRKVKRLLPFVY